MWKAILAGLILWAAGSGFGQEQQAPQPIPPAPVQGVSANVDDEAGRKDHLRQAAAHLEAAGLIEEAKKIRRMIGSDNNPAVKVQISFVEISSEKLKKLGFDYAKVVSNSSADGAITRQASSVKQVNFDESLAPNGGFAMLKQDDQYFSILKVLSKDGLAKTLAAPTIVTESGREAFLHVGGKDLPVSTDNGMKPSDREKLNEALEKIKNSGTKVNVLPVVLDRESIHLKVKGSFSELDEKHSMNIAGISVPNVKTREFCTTCDIKDGYVAVLSGLTSEQSTLIILIKAEIIKPIQPATKPSRGLLE